LDAARPRGRAIELSFGRMRRDRRGVEADALEEAQEPALATALLRRADREIREHAEGAVAPGRERPGGDPERGASVAKDDVAREEVGDGVERPRDRPSLAGGEPADREITAHGRGPGIGMSQRDPFGKPVATVRLTRGADRHERAVDRHAIPE